MDETQQLIVEKKDGTTEPFDRSKILSGIIKAGAQPEIAEKITGEIETWVKGLGVPTVKSADIREKAIEILHAADPMTANVFAGYVKPVAPYSNA